ncbi:MAG: efflux transporter outer membrane subunit [Phycisphaerae bacterium]|nr:efflux transporter outer membrane subunit [Phycisphaerae bacterium]
MSMVSGNNTALTNKPTSRLRRYRLLYLMLLLLPASLGSCTSKNVWINPPVTLPQAFSSEGKDAMPEKWWTAFGDSQLDSLIEQALRGNFSLRVAWDRLDQAQAVSAKSGAPLWPSLDGSAGASRSVTKQTLETPKGSTSERVYATKYSLGVVASYEVDLWGRVRSTRDASLLDVYATQEDLHAAAVTLTAEIAHTWYQILEQHEQLRLLGEQIQTNEKYLEIVTLKFRRGQVSVVDVLQQQQLVESTKGENIMVASAVKVLEHRLAVLVGRSPGSLDLKPTEKLPELPPLPRTGCPAEWIRRRPDVCAAELRVRAADRRVAAAIADQFPKLGLTITAETSAEQIRNLFDNWLASMAANLAAPLFDGGLRRAEVERTRAVISEQLNSYGEVVLRSLGEVEDALSQEARQAQYIVNLRKRLKLSKLSTGQMLENYTKGTASFTRYLTTLLSHQQLQRTHLQAERELVGFRIDLYRALAGSWTLERPQRAKIPEPQKSVKNSTGEEGGKPVEPADNKRS